MPYHPQSGHRSAWKDGGLFGVMLHTSSPQLLEIGGFAGLDYVIIDTEHADGVDIPGVLSLIRTADASGIPAIVRVTDVDEIGRALDFGAAGVCVTHVSSAKDAEHAVRAAKYPPQGTRGACPHVRATRFGGSSDWPSYWPTANSETLVMVLVEDVEGCENVDEIASVPGVDVIFIGPADLSQSLGVGGLFEGSAISNKVAEYQQRGIDVARQHGIATLIPVPARNSAEEIAKWAARGCQNFLWPDNSVYREALVDLLRGARSAFPRSGKDSK